MAGVYCKFPFMHLFSDSYHMMMPCCYTVCDHPYKSEKNASFKAVHLKEGAYEFFKSEPMSQLRRDMMKPDPLTPLVRDVCRNCIAAEESGLESPRKPLERVPLGRVIDIKMRIWGNACNLTCFMCNIKNSSSRQIQAKKLVEYNPKVRDFLGMDHVDNFNEGEIGYDLAIDNPELFDIQLQSFKKLSPKIRSFTIIGGEPFVMPSHYKLLDMLIESGESKNIKIIYISNMTTLHWNEKKITDYFKHFNEVEISWSVEGYGKYNDYMRNNSDWGKIIDNIKEFTPHLSLFQAGITLSSLSVLQLDKLVDWCIKCNIPYKFNNVVNPQVCRIDALHPNIRKRLADKYEGTNLEFLCQALREDIPDWEERWNNFLEYTEAIDHVNKTDYKKVFPELCDLS